MSFLPKDSLLSERKLWADLWEAFSSADGTEEEKQAKMLAIRDAYAHQRGEDAMRKALGLYVPPWKRPTVQEHLDGGLDAANREEIQTLARFVYLQASLTDPTVANAYLDALEDGSTAKLKEFILARSRPRYDIAMKILGDEKAA
jgi:hypothetical protein